MEKTFWIIFILFVVLVLGLINFFLTGKVSREEYKKTGKRPKGYYQGLGMALGIGLGMPIGISIDNISLGPALGLPLGFVLGAYWEEKNKDKIRPITKEEKRMQGIAIKLALALVVLGFISLLLIFLIK